ncbi:MAG TPA: DUF1926 domain-containing protein [Candidatus Hydrogenedentes bacterium]|nr:DUF1926 domain-containing protein [Candidatus Hydrogenedentota bacterium]
MSESINLIFGCHSHQPVGNFDHVFTWAYEQAYRPFVDVLERYPAVRVTQHFTGPLLDWFESERPDFLERLALLVAEGRIEIMGGAYYEPLLCAVPERDGLAQIARMGDFCERHFGRRPRGMWLAERVWEPHMPRILGQAGIEYTALDDTHFLCSGVAPENLFGYYVTEDEGYAVKVFPILKRLRYLIPFHQVFESLDYLRQHATGDGLRCAVIHDDGEKFGVWPGTHDSVYRQGWLEAFFEALTENSGWLRSTTYSDYLDQAQPIGRTYLTAASYEEMMAWALPTDMQVALQQVVKEIEANPARAQESMFLRGGFWRGFLAKYEEANNIHKKMLHVSGKICGTRTRSTKRLREAERLLHQGQCNCAYWHGVFGGLYMNHLRTALYQRLIAAETIIDKLAHKDDAWVRCETLDFDTDGRDEALLENAKLSLLFKPSDGGTLIEWDYKGKPFNFLNTLTRREEPYHRELRNGLVQVGEEASGGESIHELVRAKEQGLDAYLVYDPYRRVALRDHFLDDDIDPGELWANLQRERGNFHTARYRLSTTNDSVTMECGGLVESEGEPLPIHVRKDIRLAPRASSFEIRYDLANKGERPLHMCFGVELAANLLTGSAPDRYYRSDERDLEKAMLGAMGCDKALRHIALRDDWQRIECGFRFDAPADVFRFAIETVSQSEAGQERVYQGSVLIPCWRLDCPAGGSVSLAVEAEVVEV